MCGTGILDSCTPIGTPPYSDALYCSAHFVLAYVVLSMVYCRYIGHAHERRAPNLLPPRAKGPSGASRKGEQMAALANKTKMQQVQPCDMFRGDKASYSAFDSIGVPTHDEAGVPLSKNAKKKLKKLWEKQKRLYDSVQAAHENATKLR